jgi:general L-amino acid transport system permease protein
VSRAARLQILAAGLLVVVAVAWGLRVREGLAQSRVTLTLDFLRHQAGFEIGEGPAFSRSDSNLRALGVGLVNTARVAAAGVVLATGAGLAVALARLSSNPLLARLAGGYINLFRNTPLLVQLIFWYQAVIVQLPAIERSLRLGIGLADPAQGWVFLSLRGLALAGPSPGPGLPVHLTALGLAVAGALLAARWRRRVADRGGAPARTGLWVAAILAVAAAAAWLLAPGPPVELEPVARGRFRYLGGIVLSPEFLALLVSLVTYTAAFVAEVFRSGIQAVSAGQREAGLSLGLRAGQVMRLVVLPQALRVVVPPLTSQYLNLTKNSSLAIAVGYPVLFNVGQTVGNQTGQAVTMIAMIMGVYLSLSVATSAAMNWYHRSAPWSYG